jgi:hypothetical protein
MREYLCLRIDYLADSDNHKIQPRKLALNLTYRSSVVYSNLVAWVCTATSLSRRASFRLLSFCHHSFGQSASQTRPAVKLFFAASNCHAVFMNSRTKHRREAATMAEHYKRVFIHCIASMPSSIQPKIPWFQNQLCTSKMHREALRTLRLCLATCLLRGVGPQRHALLSTDRVRMEEQEVQAGVFREAPSHAHSPVIQVPLYSSCLPIPILTRLIGYGR